MEFSVAAYTDTGIEKHSNQDSLCVRRASIEGREEILMAVICDGMGGLQKGELASSTCVRAFADWFDSRLGQLPGLCTGGLGLIQSQWNELLLAVHQQLMAYGAAWRTSLGTTVAAMFACGSQFLVANVGDARVYGNRQAIQRLTQDHSVVAREVALGHITEAEARSHPQRNLLLQCIGQGGAVRPFFLTGRMQGNMVFFLCTDGYAHTVPDEELGRRFAPMLLRTKEDMTAALIRLAEDCKRCGERDNISGILIGVGENAIAPPKRGLGGLIGRLSRPKQVQPAQPVLVEAVQMLPTDERIP